MLLYKFKLIYEENLSEKVLIHPGHCEDETRATGLGEFLKASSSVKSGLNVVTDRYIYCNLYFA